MIPTITAPAKRKYDPSRGNPPRGLYHARFFDRHIADDNMRHTNKSRPHARFEISTIGESGVPSVVNGSRNPGAMLFGRVYRLVGPPSYP